MPLCYRFSCERAADCSASGDADLANMAHFYSYGFIMPVWQAVQVCPFARGVKAGKN